MRSRLYMDEVLNRKRRKNECHCEWYESKTGFKYLIKRCEKHPDLEPDYNLYPTKEDISKLKEMLNVRKRINKEEKEFLNIQIKVDEQSK